MSEFLAMGGYAGYVWSSFGIAALVLAANVVQPYWRLAATRRRIRMEMDDDADS